MLSRSLRGLPLSGRRARVRMFLVAAVGLAALVCAFGFAFGSYRPLQSGPDRIGPWRPIAIDTWFIPVLASLAVAGLAAVVRRRPMPAGIGLGASALGAVFLIVEADVRSEAIAQVNGILESGYAGALCMIGLGTLLAMLEPLLTWIERRAVYRPADLPTARVVR